MANYDDPKRRRPLDYIEEPLTYKDGRRRIDYGDRRSSATWIAAAAALAVVLSIGAYVVSTKQNDVTETKPTVTETRTTTGSGLTTPPAAPQKQ
jgi:hypothetical protein